MLIVNDNGRELTVGSRGYNIYLNGRKKYYGRMYDALKRFGWIKAHEALTIDAPERLKMVMEENLPKKTRVSWRCTGVAGPYSCQTYTRFMGVSLSLTSFTDSHLSNDGVVHSKMIPATHAQAGLHMIIQDVESKAFKDGAFECEEDLIAYISERCDVVARDMANFTVLEGSDEDDSEDEDESSEEAEEAAA